MDRTTLLNELIGSLLYKLKNRTMKSTLMDQKTEILANFDFDDLHAKMVGMNWTWYEVGIPSVAILKKKADEMLTKLLRRKTLGVYSGGFMAEKRRFKGRWVMSLIFAAEYWDCDHHLVD